MLGRAEESRAGLRGLAELLATLLRRNALRERAVFPGAVVYRGLPSQELHFAPIDPES